MVVTNNQTLYEKIKLLRVHGAPTGYFHKFVGGNFRMDALQAAILNIKLKYLDEWSDGRKKNADYYDKAFKAVGVTNNGLIQTPVPVYKKSGDRHYHIYNQYTVRVKDRDKLMAHLKANSIGCAVYYPLPLHLQECFAGLGYAKGSFPESERAGEEVLSIPIYPELTDEMKAAVVRACADFWALPK
jgi:dTDP-4-amino-4,6-dideoxygalactose transaminase